MYLHSQILQLTWKSVGRPNPSRGDNFFRRPLAPKILLVPPQVSYMVGISGKVRRGYAYQNLCNWILEGTRADLAPPQYCQFAESTHFLVYFSRNPLGFAHMAAQSSSWNVSDKYRTKIAGNPTWKMHYSELTILWRANWQYCGGAKSALIPSRIQLHKFW